MVVVSETERIPLKGNVVDYKFYMNQALRTESRISEIRVSREALFPLIWAMLSLVEMLDAYKKHIFYGKPIDQESMLEHGNNVITQMTMMHGPREDGKTDDRPLTINPRIFHGIVGLMTETGEMLEAMCKDKIDPVNLLEELGDAHWYQAILLDELQGDLSKVLATNLSKLLTRYPEKFFTKAGAVDRDLVEERKVLEEGLRGPDRIKADAELETRKYETEKADIRQHREAFAQAQRSQG